MLSRIFSVDQVTLTSTGTAVSSYLPFDQTTRKLPTLVTVKATGQGAYVRLSDDQSAATNADVLVQAGDHVVLSVNGRHWVSVLSDGASSTVSVGAMSTGVWGDAATLNLPFTTTTTLDPRITFTRALNTATYFDSAGVLTTANANVPRFDYDPATLAPRGLLIEEARTNSIRNNTMQGAVAGTPGTLPTNWNIDLSGVSGISREIVGTGTESGITYIDIRLSGTSAATASALILLDGNNAAAASPSQAWTVSSYVKLQAGSLTGIASTFLELFEYSSAPAYLRQTSAGTFTPTSSALATQRVSGTVTTGTSTAFTRGCVTIRFTAGVAADITLRIGLPQLEQGAFATSVIPTTTTALTRNADVASVTTLTPWFNASAGTLYTEVTAPQIFSSFPPQAMFHDGTASNYLLNNFGSGGAPRFERAAGGVTAGTMNASPVVAAGSLVKQASAFTLNDFALVANGGTPVTSASGNMPTVTTLRVGGYINAITAGNLLNGWLRRITYYPRRLSNAELQAITS